MNKQEYGFRPDWVSPPGETITDLMDERDWTQVELSQRLGFSPKHLNQLIRGSVSLTEGAALRLERVLGGDAQFWLNREVKYREHLARIESEENCKEWVGWLDILPLPELKKAKIIPNERIIPRNKPALVAKLLEFFGVASPDQWHERYGGMEACFRRTRESQSDVGAITSWLRLGEIEAEKFDGPKYDRSNFAKALIKIRLLTTHDPEHFGPDLVKFCYESGVALVIVPSLPRAHVSGVARWLNAHRPLIQLSLYGKTNDKFWFTFFHEAAHILLHYKEKQNIFLDDLNHSNLDSRQESEANDWSRKFLIPNEFEKFLPQLRRKDAVVAFSKEVGIHPGIVVGRLQHDGVIDMSWMNDLKASFRLVEE